MSQLDPQQNHRTNVILQAFPHTQQYQIRWTKRPKPRNPSISHFANHKTKMIQTDLFPDSDYRKKVIQELWTYSFHILIRKLKRAYSRMGEFCLYVLSRHLGTTGPRITFLHFSHMVCASQIQPKNDFVDGDSLNRLCGWSPSILLF